MVGVGWGWGHWERELRKKGAEEGPRLGKEEALRLAPGEVITCLPWPPMASAG